MRLVAFFSLIILLVIVGLSTGWCAGGADAGGAPEVKEGIIAIEGHPQNFILRRVDGDSLPFYTYVPQDMAIERYTGPEGTGFRFWLSRSDDKRNDVYATVFFFPQGTTSEQTRQFIDNLLLRSGWEQHNLKYQQKIYPWSLYEMPFTAPWYATGPTKSGLGYIVVGQHGESFFCILYHCRQSFYDGFIPRYLRILEEFVWTDTNEKLADGEYH